MFAQPKWREGWKNGRGCELDSGWATCEGGRPQIPEMAAGMYLNPGFTHLYLTWSFYDILGSAAYT